MNKTCGNCQYWHQDNSAVPENGLCRKDAPKLLYAGRFVDPTCGIWPQTRERDWCGEFKPKEPADEAE